MARCERCAERCALSLFVFFVYSSHHNIVTVRETIKKTPPPRTALSVTRALAVNHTVYPLDSHFSLSVTSAPAVTVTRCMFFRYLPLIFSLAPVGGRRRTRRGCRRPCSWPHGWPRAVPGASAALPHVSWPRAARQPRLIVPPPRLVSLYSHHRRAHAPRTTLRPPRLPRASG